MKVFYEYELEYKQLEEETPVLVEEIGNLEDEFFSEFWNHDIVNSVGSSELNAYLDSEVARKEKGQDSKWILSWWKVKFRLFRLTI